MHVMTQALGKGEEPCLPHGLRVMNTYTKMTTGSKSVEVMVKNLTTALTTITKGIKFAQVVAMNMLPLVEVAPGMLEKLDEMQGIQETRMSAEQRKEMLLQQLDLSGLEGWSDQMQAAVHALLTENHTIFSLEPGELGCTDLVKHEIRVVNDKPFKERFRRIPLPLVDKVCVHMKEMLEVGIICQWCNAVVLVCKQDRGLCFCIDFHKLNARTKKDSYLLPWIQEAIKSLAGAGYFSCLNLKAGF